MNVPIGRATLAGGAISPRSATLFGAFRAAVARLASMLLTRSNMNLRFARLLLVFTALVAIAGIAAVVWASVPVTPGAADPRRIEKICVENGGHWERTGSGGACIDTTDWHLD